MTQRDDGTRFTGHGAEWHDAKLSPDQARTATSWVEARVDKRSMLTSKDRVEDVRDALWQLEKDGEIIVQRVRDEHQPMIAKTLLRLGQEDPDHPAVASQVVRPVRQHPGLSDLAAVADEPDGDQLSRRDRPDLVHGVELSRLGHRQRREPGRVFLRNFHQAYVAGRAQGLADGHYYPLVHCGTSFGNYKEIRSFLVHSSALREKVKAVLGKLGRLVDGKLLIPEEVVHYSEWLHMMRDRIAAMREFDVSQIRATIHPACHVYKMIPEDAIYDDAILEGNRVAVSTGLIEAMGAQVIDYSTWYDCCGFGFRHIISRARVHPLVRDRPQDPGGGRGGQRRRDDRPRHRLHHHARQEPVDRPGGGQSGRPAGPRRLPVRRAGLRRASLQDRAVALARLRRRDPDGQDGHRLGKGAHRVRGLSRSRSRPARARRCTIPRLMVTSGPGFRQAAESRRG